MAEAGSLHKNNCSYTFGQKMQRMRAYLHWFCPFVGYICKMGRVQTSIRPTESYQVYANNFATSVFSFC